MYHPDDIDSIRQMTGKHISKLPPNFEAEYETRLVMLQRCGSSQPLGPVNLIPLLREYAQGPPKNTVSEVNDWEKVPNGTELVFQDKKATLTGIVSMGSVAIRVEGSDEIREVPSHSIKLAESEKKGIDLGEQEEDDEPVQYQENLTEEDAAFPVVEWSAVEENKSVLVGVDNQEGHFIGVGENGLVKVNLEGKEIDFKPNQVQLAPF